MMKNINGFDQLSCGGINGSQMNHGYQHLNHHLTYFDFNKALEKWNFTK